VWHPHQIPQRNTSKTPPRQSQEKAPKITKMGKRERQQKPWGTTPNHLYIPWRFLQDLACLPIILPSLKISPWSSQASPLKS
jgi:hypothetical protein